MYFPLSIPIVVKNVKIIGPKGQIKVDLLLDTGAAYSSLSWPDLKLIGYDPAIATAREQIITANGIIEVPKLTVETIATADIFALKVDVICHDIPELAGIRGLLGLSFLKNFKTVIDFKKGYLEIS